MFPPLPDFFFAYLPLQAYSKLRTAVARHRVFVSDSARKYIGISDGSWGVHRRGGSIYVFPSISAHVPPLQRLVNKYLYTLITKGLLL